MKSLFATGLLMILTCGLALAQEQSCALTQQTEEWKLAFVRNNNIWVSKGDGTDQRMIIKNGRSPYWSPGKNQIAFARNNNVWIAKADVTGSACDNAFVILTISKARDHFETLET